LLAVPLLAACEGPLSTLSPAGPIASEIARLWWVMLIGAGLITVLVMVLLSLALLRNKTGEDPGRSERRWIYGWGLGFTLTGLTLLLGFALWTGERMLARDDGTPTVQAQASQWTWNFVQPGPDGAPVATRGVLYVPAGRPFDVQITSTDVIHGFWVPQLGGKMDAIPGHPNLHRLMATTPGRYEGQCAEFCGRGHAFMRFEVVAYDPAGPMPDFISDPQLTREAPLSDAPVSITDQPAEETR
jgi:cytochrome c oxidase subunit II